MKKIELVILVVLVCLLGVTFVSVVVQLGDMTRTLEKLDHNTKRMERTLDLVEDAGL